MIFLRKFKRYINESSRDSHILTYLGKNKKYQHINSIAYYRATVYKLHLFIEYSCWSVTIQDDKITDSRDFYFVYMTKLNVKLTASFTIDKQGILKSHGVSLVKFNF